MQKKRLDQNDKLNFKIYDVTAWSTKNYKTQIAQDLTNDRQPGNEIWSVNRISQKKYILKKNYAENEEEKLVPDQLVPVVF